MFCFVFIDTLIIPKKSIINESQNSVNRNLVQKIQRLPSFRIKQGLYHIRRYQKHKVSFIGLIYDKIKQHKKKVEKFDLYSHVFIRYL